MPSPTSRRRPALPALAEELGVERIWAKDETTRFDLPAFKVLGASWAVERTLAERPAVRSLVAATDGNHGRAVARLARLRGLKAHILVPDDMLDVRRQAIAAEGATVEIVAGSYDDAVRRSASLEAGPGRRPKPLAGG